MRIHVSQPVHQHAYQVALAAQDQGWLEGLSTMIYRTGRGPSSERIMALMPYKVRRRMDQAWLKRYHPSLNPAWVRTHSYLGSIATVARWVPLATHKAQRATFRLFDRVVAGEIEHGSGADVVHAFEGTALHTLRTARRIGARAVLDVAGSAENYIDILQASGVRTSEVPYARLLCEREVADLLIAPSEAVIDGLLRAGATEDRIALCPFGVDVQRFAPGPKVEGRCRFLFVGQIGIRKGVPLLLEAWSAAATTLPDAELILVGEVDEVGARLVRHLPPKVRWLGSVPRHEVHELFHHSDVFVFPSYAEGSALVTYEAMASGLPLITTVQTGSVAVDGEHGRVLPAAARDDLVDAIRELYVSPYRRKEWGTAARAAMVANFTWEHYRERLRRVWRS